MAIFPSHAPSATVPHGAIRTPLQFSLILSSSLDIFEARARANATTGAGLSGDFGLLQALDERLAVYGFETNTGVKFVAVVDMRGRKLKGVEEAAPGDASASAMAKGKGRGAAAAAAASVVGLREGEVKVVCVLSDLSVLRGLISKGADPGLQRLQADFRVRVGIQSYASGLHPTVAESLL